MNKAVCAVFAAFSLLLAPIPASSEINCPSTKYGSIYKPDKGITDKPEIVSSVPLTDSGKITCKVDWGFRSGTNDRVRVERGVYKGLKYRVYYSDGSGAIQGLSGNTLHFREALNDNWRTTCRVDGMDDSHWCALLRGSLAIGIGKSGRPLVSIGSEHFPGSKITIRIDKNPPITAMAGNGFSEQQAKEIIDQLKGGETVLTRYVKWPRQSNVDESHVLFEVEPALELLKKLHESVGYKPLQTGS